MPPLLAGQLPSTPINVGKSTRIRPVYDDLVAIGADEFEKEELEEALRAIASTISKCEKCSRS